MRSSVGLVVALVGWMLTGCPNLDQLRGGGNDGTPGDDAGNADGGQQEPNHDGGQVLITADGGLIGAWDFEGNGGVAEDLSGAGHPAELVAGATQEPGAGIRGGGLVLHGFDNANVPSLSGDAFPRTGTLSLWLRYTEASSGFGVFDTYEENRAHFFVRQRPGDQTTLQVGFQTIPDTGDYAWEHMLPATPATWTHIAVTWDESAQSAAAWVNGGRVYDAAFKRAFAFGDQRVVLGDQLKASIDELRIYRVVLSSDDIKALAARP